MPQLDSIQRYSRKPIDLVQSMEISFHTILTPKSIAVRFLLLLQLVTSTIAIPTLLLLGLYLTSTNPSKESKKFTWIEMGNDIKFHIMIGIAVSAVGLVSPFEIAAQFSDKQDEALNKWLTEIPPPELPPMGPELELKETGKICEGVYTSHCPQH